MEGKGFQSLPDPLCKSVASFLFSQAKFNPKSGVGGVDGLFHSILISIH